MKRVWRFFSSISLTVVLAVLICVVAAWGSVEVLHSRPLYDSLSREVLARWLVALPPQYLSSVYWIFALIFLVFLFSVNTAVCTVDRVWKIIKTKSPMRTLFPHVVHAGFLMAVLGHLAGSLWGFRSSGNIIYRGEPAPVPYTEGLSVVLEGVEEKRKPSGDIDLLRTTITLRKDKKKILTGPVELNAPLIYRGMAFYYADHGMAPTGLVLEVGERTVRLGFSGKAALPGGLELRAGHIYPDLAFDAEGRPFNRSEEFRNPYIELLAGERRAFLSLSRPGTRTRMGDTEIVLKDLVLTPYVILNINKDPGIIPLLAGSGLLVAGMVLVLFFRGERSELVRDRGRRQGP